jgi:hypothetical protein
MNPKQGRRGPGLVVLIIGVLVLLTGLIGAPIAALGQATLQPTETAVPLSTPTAVPTSTPAALPAVNWSDISVHRQAMKPAFASDVNQFVTANRYLIVARLSIETDAVIRGAERVRFTNRTPDVLNEIVFRLYPNSPVLAGRMNVTHVTVGSSVVEPVLSALDTVMTIPLQQPLSPGRAVEMLLDFTVTMTRGLDASYGRFGFVHNVVSATAWYPTLSVYDVGLGWWKSLPSPQGDPAYTESGLYDVRLTAPADMTVAMSGVEIDKTENADGTLTHRGVTGPMRDFAFQASTRYVVDSTEVDGTRLNVVHYKDPANPTVDATDAVMKYAAFAMQTYNKAYGEYPFKEYNVVENPTPTGVEFPGLVQIAENSWVKGNNFLEITVAHETAHQWFYSLIGNNQVEHPWLDEGLARYSEFVYTRAAYGEAAGNEYINRYQRNYERYTGQGLPDMPVDEPVRSFAPLAYGVIVYNKGGLFVVELERELGRDVVNKALKEYVRRYKYAVVTSADFKRVFEEVSGKDLTAVFEKWIGGFEKDSQMTPVPETTAVF